MSIRAILDELDALTFVEPKPSTETLARQLRELANSPDIVFAKYDIHVLDEAAAVLEKLK